MPVDLAPEIMQCLAGAAAVRGPRRGEVVTELRAAEDQHLVTESRPSRAALRRARARMMILLALGFLVARPGLAAAASGDGRKLLF